MTKSLRYGEGPAADGETPKKRRIRKSQSGGPLEIPRDMIPDGIDLMWVPDSILGQPSPNERVKFEINAWEPVTPDMFDARFDGMFMPKGHRGEINVGGMVLEWRPIELTMEARAEDIAAAHRATQTEEQKLRQGDVPGLTPGFADTRSRSAQANTRVVRTIEPGGEIPR